MKSAFSVFELYGPQDHTNDQINHIFDNFTDFWITKQPWIIKLVGIKLSLFDVQIMSAFSAFHVQVKKYFAKFADRYFQKQFISLAVNWWKIKTCNDNSNSAPIALLIFRILN